MRKLFLGCTLLFLFVATVLAWSPWQATSVQALQRPENDDIFDVESYNGFQEDALVVRPLGEFFPPLDFEFTFNFDVDISGSIFNPDTEVDTDFTGVLTPNFSPEEQFQKKSAEIEAPRANIQVSTAVIEPEAVVTVSAQPQGFQSVSGIKDLFYAWGLENVALNGVAAGADPLDLPSASGIRSTHSRTPETDRDQDGMDDDWEIRYDLDPTNPGDAGQDPDQDGFVNDFYDNEFGEILIVQPETSAGPPGASLTNLEEYIWGTDPTSPDTDGDGFSDGQDIAGLGQTSINLLVPPDAQPGDELELRLTVLGESYQKFNRDQNLVKLDSTTKTLIVSDNEQVAASLSIDNPSPAPGDTVTLEASLGQTEFHEGLLTYEWFVNSVSQPEASGESAFTFTYEIPVSTLPGDIITFGVRAQNFETGQQAEAELDVLIGDLLELSYDPESVVEDETITINANLLNGTPPEELIFHWSENGVRSKTKSGQGQTAYTKEITEGAGDTFEIGLRVTEPEKSQEIARSIVEVQVQKPEVELVPSTEKPGQDQIVQFIAIPKYFKTEDLIFEWFEQGIKQEGIPETTREFFALSGPSGSTLNIAVKVISQGENPSSARAELSLEVGPPVSTSEATQENTTLAQLLRDNPKNVAWGTLGVLVLATSGILFLSRRRKNDNKLP